MNTKPIAYVEQIVCDSIWSSEKNRYIKGRRWWSANCHEVAIGLEQLGYQVKGFLKEELDKLPITKDTIVRGSVRTTRRAFRLLGIKGPKNIDIPNSLKKFTYRKIWISTVGQVIKYRKQVHIKPYEVQKGFKGFVFDHHTYMFRTYPKNYKLLVSERVYFDGEFRTYVLNGKILDTTARNENEKAFVAKLVAAYKDAPAAYAIDCGWMRKGSYSANGTLALVEVNEGFSAGKYNMSYLSSKDYARMTEARWKEIMST